MRLLSKPWQRRYRLLKYGEFVAVVAIYTVIFVWCTGLPGTFSTAFKWLIRYVLVGLEVLIYYVMFLSLKYNFFRWWQTVRLLGFPSSGRRRAMRSLSLLREHKYGTSWPQFCIIGAILIGLLYFTHVRIFLALLLALTQQHFIEPLRRSLPPTVFLLTTTATGTPQLHAKISFVVRRLRAVALLKVKRSDEDLASVFTRLDCFRTESDDDDTWVYVVEKLLQIAPIVVLDARVVTDAVLLEAKRTLVPSVAYKLILLVGQSGERLLLDHPDLWELPAPLKQIPVVREAGLLTMLHFLTRSRDRIPSPERPLDSILKASGEWRFIGREDWATM